MSQSVGPASAPTRPPFARIKLAGAAGSFGKVELLAGDDVTDVAERACAKFSHWRVNSGQLFVYLVAEGGDNEPAEDAVRAKIIGGDRLGSAWSLARAGIASGSWLAAQIDAEPSGAWASTALQRAHPFIFDRAGPRASQRGSADQRGGAGQQVRAEPPAPLQSPLPFRQHVAQVAQQPALHWLSVAFQRVGYGLYPTAAGVEGRAVYGLRGSAPHAAGVLCENEPLAEGGGIPPRALSFGGADGVEGADMKED